MTPEQRNILTYHRDLLKSARYDFRRFSEDYVRAELARNAASAESEEWAEYNHQHELLYTTIKNSANRIAVIEQACRDIENETINNKEDDT